MSNLRIEMDVFLRKKKKRWEPNLLNFGQCESHLVYLTTKLCVIFM